MKAPDGLLPITISAPDDRDQVDIESADAELIGVDTCSERAAFIKVACNSHDALVEKLQAQFKAVDWLMAKLIAADPTFMPSQSPIWDSIKGTNEVLAAAGAA